MSKSALDRLGTRLAANEPVAETDREAFAAVASFYQEVLDTVTAQLAALGFEATPRVKTTPTLVDKLRRQHTRLSQVQDLAGARFTVQDRAAQDWAVAAITSKYESLGCTYKVDDLRGDPSHGYRAVHVIVSVDRVPVEIQVRTELQDSWAQIVEDLGDRWGRGIRYGGEPEHADALIRAGDIVTSRRAAMGLLVVLSEAIAKHEQDFAQVEDAKEALDELVGAFEQIAQRTTRVGVRNEDTLNEISPDLRDVLVGLGETFERAPAIDASALMTGWREGTFAEYVAALRRVLAAFGELVEGVSATLRSTDHQLRGMLRLVADAADEDG
jgi:ppGpp synthetase/RelA/SpoT-type nucleotidyltranferase